MTLPDALLLPLYLLAFLIPGVGWILTRAALHSPRINALTFMAAFVDAVAVLIPTYLLAVANSAFGYPFPREFGQIVLRAVIIALGLICLYFLRLYWTGRFRDGA